MNKEVKIAYPQEKLDALVYFLKEENRNVEEMLTAFMDKSYEKNVPAPVRKYVESMMGQEGQETSRQECGESTDQQETVAQEQESRQPRRYVRRNARVHPEEATGVLTETGTAEAAVAEPEENTELQGMAMEM